MSAAHDSPGPVAIIGMAARVPGAQNVFEYWRNLREGVESITRHTKEEMLARGAPPTLVGDPHYVNASAMLADVECFDATFFGYSAREASIMDPQHRVFLECAYHALEDAAYDPERYTGLIGVFAGCTMNTYLLYNVMARAADVVAVVGDLQAMIGNDKDYLTTRVSHKLDLRGPSVTVQTACSSSLVAVHQACQAVLNYECDMALAGGASVRLPHGAGYLANPGGTSSPDGHCRAFDAGAGGSVVGNGVGVVVVKRLADALRDHDQIHAVIRGSAVNNDGRTKPSFTAPGVEGQAAAAATALRRAAVSARDIRFVETHGTGTPMGDPIEVAALTRAFRHSTDDTGYCWLGSAKPNIGHLDAAAGVAGLIKAVLVLKHRQVPPVANFRQPNPELHLERTPFLVPHELVPLNAEGTLLASVNAIAMGGTNAHVVLAEAPAAQPGSPSAHSRQPVMLSARSAGALEEMSQALGQWVRENPGADLADIGYTLATGRRELEYRQTVIARDLQDAAYGLATPGSPRRHSGTAARGSARLAFLFPGQGTQRVGMGLRLAAGDRVFAHHFATVLDLFLNKAGLDVAAALKPGPEDAGEAGAAALAETHLAQPAIFAVEWALGRALQDYGLRPYAMLGHSIGELAAATLAGVLGIADAVEMVALRGRVMRESPQGAMLYVNCAPARLAARLEKSGLTIAAVNAGELVVVSGAPEAVGALEGELRAEGMPCGRLDVTRAFHSPLMEPAATAFAAAIQDRDLAAPSGLVVSNVTGTYLTAAAAVTPQYWADQMRLPVRFADGLRTLARDGVTLFLEIGPGRSLHGLVQAAVPDATCLHVLEAKDGTEAGDLTELLAGCWLRGGEVDWATYYQDESRSRIRLPTYPFARTKHWLDPTPSAAAVTPAAAPAAAAPAAAPHNGSGAHRSGDGGRTPMQRYLTNLWCDLLGIEQVRLHDNFFDLDGHSLLVMQMVTRIRKDIDPDLDMATVFEAPTIAALSGHLESRGVRIPAREDPAADGPPAEALLFAEPPAQVDGEQVAALMAEIESLSDDEVRERLAMLEERGKADDR
jgi:acyl transferase domain-containing protein